MKLGMNKKKKLCRPDKEKQGGIINGKIEANTGELRFRVIGISCDNIQIEVGDKATIITPT